MTTARRGETRLRPFSLLSDKNGVFLSGGRTASADCAVVSIMSSFENTCREKILESAFCPDKGQTQAGRRVHVGPTEKHLCLGYRDALEHLTLEFIA
jgi:hypothetical protein